MFRRGRDSESVNFTNGCRRALLAAREESERLESGYVGTEHLLLAIVNAPEDDAEQLIATLGLKPSRVNRDVEALLPRARSSRRRDGEVPYTSRAKKVLELAMSEARELRDEYVSTGHLFLALIREEKGIAAQVLRQHGVAYSAARAAVANRPATRNKRFAVQIDDSAERSIYEQIVSQVQEAVATGELVAGERLTTVRELADALDIAPGTVARAYSELERLGVVATDGARGTRVATQPQRTVTDAARPETLVGLLRPVTVAAFHLGASAPEVREALERAMRDIFPTAPPP